MTNMSSDLSHVPHLLQLVARDMDLIVIGNNYESVGHSVGRGTHMEVSKFTKPRVAVYATDDFKNKKYAIQDIVSEIESCKKQIDRFTGKEKGLYRQKTKIRVTSDGQKAYIKFLDSEKDLKNFLQVKEKEQADVIAAFREKKE